MTTKTCPLGCETFKDVDSRCDECNALAQALPWEVFVPPRADRGERHLSYHRTQEAAEKAAKFARGLAMYAGALARSSK